MPALNEPEANFDEYHDFSEALGSQTPVQAPAPPRKSKKKLKANGARRKTTYEEADESPQPQSLTSTPPQTNGVLLPDVLSNAEHSFGTSPPTDTEDAREEQNEHLPEAPRDQQDIEPAPSIRSPRSQHATLATSPPAQGNGFQYASSASPPARAIPVRTPSQYTSLGGYRPNAQRRASVLSNQSQRPRFPDPPPPHMAQAHFFGAPDIGLNLGGRQEHGKMAGSDGYCCVFDSFVDAGDAASARQAKDVLLVGSEGGLEVYRVLHNKMEVVGRLEGLNGSVIGAKILPHTQRGDTANAMRPLVAVVVHGSMMEDRRDSGETSRPAEMPTQYQTAVEVYSLCTQRHVATLFTTLPVASKQAARSHLSETPQPIGDLCVNATGRFITVASGKSGEMWIFTSSVQHPQTQFRCIGKYWTSLQLKAETTSSRPSSSSEADAPQSARQIRGVPLLSLSNRWLALAPPPSSSQISIQGTPLCAGDFWQPPGLTTHVAPGQPPVTCEIVEPGAESALGRLTRQTTNEIRKASQGVWEMGKWGYKELMQPTPIGAQHHRTTSYSGDHELFPPTNGPAEDPRKAANDPTMISVIDLHRLLDAEEHKAKHLPAPLATFTIAEGCNFLSFSPTGLRLLTSSRKGDISCVWDLLHLSQGPPTRLRHVPGVDEAEGPSVRQIHRIVRGTPSIIANAVWTREGDMVAILTEHGTIHLHYVPENPVKVSQQRNGQTKKPQLQDKADATVAVSTGISPPSGNGFLGSVRTGWHTFNGQVSAVRSRSGSTSFAMPTFQSLKDATTAARTAGGRAVVYGLRQGYGAAAKGATQLWHAEDNKLRLQVTSDGMVAGSLQWASAGKSRGCIAVVAAGRAHLYPVQRVATERDDGIVYHLKATKPNHQEFALPPISRSYTKIMPVDGRSDCAKAGPHGFWSLNSAPVSMRRPSNSKHGRPPMSQMSEMETNPPYAPFHIAPHVNIHAFDVSSQTASEDLLALGNNLSAAADLTSQGHGSNEPWVFGGQLPPSTKMNSRSYPQMDDFDQGVTDADFNEVASQLESHLTVRNAGDKSGERLSVTTRRKPRRLGGDVDGPGEATYDGDFELVDEDDDMM